MNNRALPRNTQQGGNTMLRRGLFIIAPAASIFVATSAQADWPTSRHDPQRTGVAQAYADITTPAVYWKAYVGGNVDPQGLLVGDVDQDGKPDVLYVSGGSVVAMSATGVPMWRTPARQLQYLYAIDDFDGDGHTDVLVGGASQAILLAGKDGSFEWSEDPADFGTLGALRVTDLNGDGRPDVIAEECHCCEVTNNATGFAFSFARSGGAIVASKLWTIPAFANDFSSCGVPTVVFDGNGDGHPELAHAGQTRMYVLDRTGAMIVDGSHSPALGGMLYYGDCLPSDVDGVPGEELVCFQKLVFAVDPTSQRQVYVLHMDATTSPASIQLLWQNTTLADQAGGDLDYQPDAVVDLDGNGTKEVVVSGMAASGTWTTYIFDAKSGATLATIPNARTAGTAHLRSDKIVNVLTSNGKDLTAWTFDATQPTPLQQAWTKPDRRTMTRVDSSLLRTVRANTALVLPDLNGDSVADLLTAKVSAGTVLYDDAATTNVPKQLATFVFPTDVDPVSSWMIPATTRPYPQVAMAANDGVLRIFDNQLEPTVPVRTGGFCAGAWQRSPVVASLGGVGGTQSVFVSDSRGALLRFDPHNASIANPPKPTWSRRNCTSPSIFPALDGAHPGIVCTGAQEPVSYPALPALSALRGDSSLVWNAPLTGKGVTNDALPGSPDVSGVPAVLVQSVDQQSQVTTRSFSGSTGAQTWASSPVAPQWGTTAFSTADWNGDGTLDVLTILNSMEAISGTNGSTITSSADFLGYGLPLIKDVNADGVLDVTVQGGFYPARTLQHDLTTATWVGANTEPYPAGAIAECSDGLQLVEGSTLFPARLYLTKVAGATPGTSSFVVLAGGKQYPDETTATAAGSYIAQLSDLSLATNLTGTGHPTAVVGSSDGWLYAVDACSGTIQFTMPLNESICGAVFGDTDADGHDEIIVGTSGGFLYDIQQQELPSCGPVRDVDPPHGIPDQQVAQIVTQATLFGAWTAVDGAAGYEVAVTHDPEGIVSSPPWQDVGNVTAAQVSDLPLVAGQTYHFAVRAVGPQGRSVDSVSPGVTVMDTTVHTGSSSGGSDAGAVSGSSGGPPNQATGGGSNSTGGGGGGGCAMTGSSQPPFFLFVAAGVGLIAFRRRGARVTDTECSESRAFRRS
jgi:hypothetical protein